VKETFIDIVGLHIQEPVTVLTNVIITAFCLFFYFQLNVISIQPKLKKYWRLFFLLFGVSALIGALAHGFKSYFQPNVFYYIWLIMNLSGLSITYYLLRVNIEMSFVSDENKIRLHYLVVLIILIFSAITIITNDFLIVKINAGIAILVTLIRHYRAYKKGYTGSGYIAFGFAFSTLSIIVHSTKLSLNEWFNFKDISHVIMNISLYIIFIGVLLKLKFIEEVSTREKIQ